MDRATDACNAAGGVVYMAGGSFLSGTVVLNSNITLYLEADATLVGSSVISDYGEQSGPPERATPTGKHLVLRAMQRMSGWPARQNRWQGHAFWIPSQRNVPPPEDSWRDVATTTGSRSIAPLR